MFWRQILLSIVLGPALVMAALAQDPAEARDMALVGYHDLQGRSAYQPLVHAQGGRWIAYIGLHGDHLPNELTSTVEDNGTAILDVTNPRRPKPPAHIPGEPGRAAAGGAQMVRVDVTAEFKPFSVANWTGPEASGNFCGRGGRFGTHSSNESFSPIYYKRIMFFAHFNAGVRAVDIRDP
jgi:hypothetical protein